MFWIPFLAGISLLQATMGHDVPAPVTSVVVNEHELSSIPVPTKNETVVINNNLVKVVVVDEDAWRKHGKKSICKKASKKCIVIECVEENCKEIPHHHHHYKHHPHPPPVFELDKPHRRHRHPIDEEIIIDFEEFPEHHKHHHHKRHHHKHHPHPPPVFEEDKPHRHHRHPIDEEIIIDFEEFPEHHKHHHHKHHHHKHHPHPPPVFVDELVVEGHPAHHHLKKPTTVNNGNLVNLVFVDTDAYEKGIIARCKSEDKAKCKAIPPPHKHHHHHGKN